MKVISPTQASILPHNTVLIFNNRLYYKSGGYIPNLVHLNKTKTEHVCTEDYSMCICDNIITYHNTVLYPENEEEITMYLLGMHINIEE